MTQVLQQAWDSLILSTKGVVPVLLNVIVDGCVEGLAARGSDLEKRASTLVYRLSRSRKPGSLLRLAIVSTLTFHDIPVSKGDRAAAVSGLRWDHVDIEPLGCFVVRPSSPE